ncbi:calcium-activated chloride channel regulator 1-like isoform X2 [Daphnia carinata]|uniref:calcium-activated chloride channel regulator 1-like isoform X2 n=1 Tax=Daphnia carinata TaxID=120202 RepID=UPI00257DECC5|nr:calcium-activated chloride channel regulator 1-like isoform X2 [Daphnia carinata]
MARLRTKNMYVFVPLFFVLITSPLTSTSHITLTTDGYQNVVVAIDENSGFTSCQEDLENIKELMRSTSVSFGQGLERPAYFGDVTIVLPNSWVSDPICSMLMTMSNITQLPWARTHSADIRITPDHPVFGNQPHSFQYGGCQEPGLSINVPSTFVSNFTDLMKARIMAREWAHYRYGVFDEGGIPDDERHPSGYMMFQTENSDKVMRANTCTGGKTPRGEWNNEECKSTNSGNSSCEFQPDVDNPDITSSLMYRPDLDHMEKFCTKENHDDGVPSKLSYHCGSLSASDVIYKHLDFTPGVTPANASAEITFNVIQNPFSGYHVVLDIASFSSKQLFDQAKNSLMQFIAFLLDPVLMSIDTYDGVNVVELQSPLYLDPRTIRTLLGKLERVGYATGSPNAFGIALERAQTRSSFGQDVIILTAVQTIPDMTDWITSYNENKVIVHLVHFGVSTAKVEMAQLVRYGSVHVIPNVANSNLMNPYTWSVNTLQSIYGKTRSYRAKIFEQSVIKINETDTIKTGYFYLDSPASHLLVSVYCLNTDQQLDVDYVSIFQPDGYPVRNETTKNDTFAVEDFYSFVVGRYPVATLPAGMWSYTITFDEKIFTEPIVHRLDIWAEAADSSQVQVRTWNTALDNQPLDYTKAPVGLYAQVTQDRRPVRGANVTAYVYVTDGVTSNLFTTLPLLDEGISDVTTGDGIYSAWLTTPSYTSHSYSVYYKAYGVNSLAVIDNGTYTRPPTTGSVIPMSNPVATGPQFNRYEYGSSFQLAALLSSSFDLIRPERVTDLSVLSYDASSRIAELGWTAPKDNYGSGEIVTRFRLYQSIGSAESNYTEFTTPVNADGSVNLTVQVPHLQDGEYVKYRVVGKDSSNNMADPSNVVSMAGPVLRTGGISNSAMWALIGVAIAILVIILIIVLIRCCCPVEAKRRQRQAKRKVRQWFSFGDKTAKRTDTAPSTRYQSPPPTIQQWNSPTINQDGESPAVRSGSDASTTPQPEVELRQKTAAPARTSTYGSERIYFGQEDIDRMVSGPRSETYSEKGTEEIIKRAPSMDLQLATILRMNSSNFSIDRLGRDEKDPNSRPTEVIRPRVYARPFKPNQPANRPTSNQPASRGYPYNANKPLSMSETNLYYTDVALRPPVAQSTKSSPSNSYLSVYAERADVVPQPSGQSSLANTLRNGMRGNEQWQDSNSFIYTDPRLDGQSKGSSSFDPQLHPANQNGLPPPLPSVPPPFPPRMTYNIDMGYDGTTGTAMWLSIVTMRTNKR